MKKFICMMVALMAFMAADATAQMKAYSPPEQTDVGYVQKNVATLSIDGMTVIQFDAQYNIVDWQTPVTLTQEESTASAQVFDAFTIPTDMGNVGMTLVAYRWPDCKPNSNSNTEAMNTYAVSVPPNYAHSFQSAHTDSI